jgi:hypothetical protein
MAEEKEMGIGARADQWVRDNHARQPALSGQVEAWVRQGAKDLQNAVLHAFPDSQRLHEEMGAPGSPTAQMVSQDLGRSYNAQTDMTADRGSVHGRGQEMTSTEKDKDGSEKTLKEHNAYLDAAAERGSVHGKDQAMER